MMQDRLSKMFGSYMGVGVANTMTSILIIVVMLFYGFSDELSNFLGIAGGIIQSIILNSKFTFRQKYIRLNKSFYFFLILFFSYLINLMILFVCINYIGLSSLISQLAGISFYILVSFLCLEKFLFNNSIPKLK